MIEPIICIELDEFTSEDESGYCEACGDPVGEGHRNLMAEADDLRKHMKETGTF